MIVRSSINTFTFILLLFFSSNLFFWSTANAQELLWSDEFNSGDDVNFNVWSYETGGGGWGNQELQEYSENNVKVENDNLVITTIKEEATNTITSGRIQTNGKLQYIYARIEARIKVPNPANGLWPSLWMLGADFDAVGWPNSGSMTLMQMGSADALQAGQATTQVGSALHWAQDGAALYEFNAIDSGMDLTSDFFTYVMDWTPESITTYVNDVPILQKDITAAACSACDEFHKPYFFILSVAAGGSYMNLFNVDDISAPLPAELLVDYVRIYDNGFTQVSGSGATMPTATPTVPPTTTAPAPTESPTTAPAEQTEPPTEANTTPEPTPEPTLPPTTTIPNAPETTPPPTSAPTPELSTPEPTASPTASSTSSDTDLPVSDKETTGDPTASPTLDPALYPLQNIQAEGISMTLQNVGPLDPKSQAKWAEITQVHMANEVLNTVGSSVRVDVVVELVSQNPPYNNVERRVLLRSLQSDEQELVFNADYTMQTPSPVDDVNPFITGAFVSNYKKAIYLERLRAYGGSSFQNASYVSVKPATNTVTTSAKNVQGDQEPKKNTAADIGIIVGIATAGLVVLILGLALYARRRSKRAARAWAVGGSFSSDHDDVDMDPHKAALENSAYGTIDDESMYTSHPQHRVPPTSAAPRESTYFAGAVSSSFTRSNDDADGGSSSTKSTLESSYNYNDAYKNVSKSVVSGTLGSGSTTKEEQETVCDEFTVEAPKGKLGLILETSDEGCPVVQEIKPTSPLNGCVQVGDRLHSVDGRDVTMVMSATVSRVIASKQNSNVRKFVFARPQEHKVSVQHE